jgi:predicted HTH domain antitoxin
MATETIEVKIPKELLIGMEKEKLVEEIKLFMAMRLYEMKVLSLGKAAELAGKDKDEFMEALSEHGIDVIRYSKEELDEEIKFLKGIK